MAIPVRNVYYLLSYAWNLLEEANQLNVEAEKIQKVIDLLARLLIHGTQRLLKRGMDRDYVPQTDILTTLRGRVEIAPSIRRLLFQQGKAQCRFDEFLPDLLHNQIILATLKTLLALPELSEPQRQSIITLLKRMGGITPIQVRKCHFSKVRLHNNNSHYRLLLKLCELVHDNMLVSENSGQTAFKDFLRDEAQMAKLFETFVGNFMRMETPWTVETQKRIRWDTGQSVENSALPEMKADTVISRKDKKAVAIIETKYYREAMAPGYYGEVKKVRSLHLYQLHAYITNYKPMVSGTETQLKGVLLYPVVAYSLDETFRVKGSDYWVRTIDLNQQWEKIHCDLVAIGESSLNLNQN